MLLQRPNAPSRVTLLLTAALLIGGVGCFTPRISDGPSRQQMEQQMAQQFQRREATAAQGDVQALVDVGFSYVHGNGGAPRDLAKGMAYLERAAATGHGVGLSALGLALLNNNLAGPRSPAEQQRGIELVKQAAVKGCAFQTSQYGTFAPHAYLANQFQVTDPAQSDLWRARGIMHCNQKAYSARSTVQASNAAPAQVATDRAAWQFLDKTLTSCEAAIKAYPLADCTTAQRRADELRDTVRATEADAPPLPRRR